MSDYPEHDKLHQVKEQSQAIGEFLDWVYEEKDASLIIERDDGERFSYHSLGIGIEKLLAEFFKIDLQKIGEEKDTMLRHVRELNDARGQ